MIDRQTLRKIDGCGRTQDDSLFTPVGRQALHDCAFFDCVQRNVAGQIERLTGQIVQRQFQCHSQLCQRAVDACLRVALYPCGTQILCIQVHREIWCGAQRIARFAIDGDRFRLGR